VYSLGKFHSRVGRVGTPLPTPFPSFDANRIRMRRGATSLLAGQPGSFKSVMALNMMVHWAEQNCTTLYLSADSDEFTVVRRVAGILSGRDMEQIEEQFNRKDYDYLLPLLGSLDKARLEYRAVDIDGIAERLAAYEAVQGDYPDVLFVDNLINFASSAQDWAGMIDFQNELDALARETKSHICILHHVTDAFPFGVPVPRSAIQGKVTQIPRVVLTVAAVGMQLMVSCVKNTNGPQHPSGDKWMNFQVQPSLRVEDVEFEGVMTG
jgi:hypothetical protein